ncbi:MAG: thioredoxin domain-containing protein [Aminobacterium sp.]|nr:MULTISPECIES: thioredoxin domain-containing protein [unclassified Aminobacterium]MDD2206148.1 thioredoxin domain-containing protein [Aminobacterium sp.]MDD3425443.1 thioredoxin domain-containing protein [Aminobacterium sp.]MDD4228008.1 thioredoxin domain-containing protein [Aminobacterium sp.]MDD4551145.1 thioredoxin domain-containing protein [Aminobacterium sp.]MEA4876407.1 thioredoxin domain-containing protein [Aminobacterium sp.]
MVELTKENFDAEVKESSLPVLVDFWGPKCGPCMALLPNVHKMAEEFEGKVKFTSVDVSQNRRVAINNRVMGLPTFLFWKDGKEVARISGAEVTLEKIKENVEKLL